MLYTKDGVYDTLLDTEPTKEFSSTDIKINTSDKKATGRAIHLSKSRMHISAGRDVYVLKKDDCKLWVDTKEGEWEDSK